MSLKMKTRKKDVILTAIYDLPLTNLLLWEYLRPYLHAEGINADWMREQGGAFADLAKHAKKAVSHAHQSEHELDLCNAIYETRIETQRDRCMKNKNNGKFSAEIYDNSLSDANELARLVLLYLDTCMDSQENSDAVFKFMRSLPKPDRIITEDDLASFYPQR